MPRTQHLLETRFSVRLGDAPLDPDWVEERIELLRGITLPAVAAQTSGEFTWVVLCDEATGDDALCRLREEERRLPAMRVEMTGASRTPLAAMRSLVREDADVLITTRLDSDDLIADAYLEAVRAYAEPFHRSRHSELLVNFPHGHWLDVRGARVYPIWYPNAPFHSLFERPRIAAARTVMREGHEELRRRYAGYRLRVQEADGLGWHVQLHQHYPTHQDESMAAWMLCVHGGNVTNHIPRDARPLPNGAWPAGFSARPLLR